MYSVSIIGGFYEELIYTGNDGFYKPECARVTRPFLDAYLFSSYVNNTIKNV